MRNNSDAQRALNLIGMKLYIKYMVSLRCKMVVKAELKKIGLDVVSLNLGVIETAQCISPEKLQILKLNLKRAGLELLDDKRSILVEKIKNVIVEMVHYSDEKLNVNFSDFISNKLNYDYTYLSNIFSEVRGVTIQQFIILNKIERIKELMLYDELSLSEISYKLDYSSPAHLSNQFKKMTGLTPSFYKQMKRSRKTSLENL